VVECLQSTYSKLVKIWQSYCQRLGAWFFGTRCTFRWTVVSTVDVVLITRRIHSAMSEDETANSDWSLRSTLNQHDSRWVSGGEHYSVWDEAEKTSTIYLQFHGAWGWKLLTYRPWSTSTIYFVSVGLASSPKPSRLDPTLRQVFKALKCRLDQRNIRCLEKSGIIQVRSQVFEWRSSHLSLSLRIFEIVRAKTMSYIAVDHGIHTAGSTVNPI